MDILQEGLQDYIFLGSRKRSFSTQFVSLAPNFGIVLHENFLKSGSGIAGLFINIKRPSFRCKVPKTLDGHNSYNLKGVSHDND